MFMDAGATLLRRTPGRDGPILTPGTMERQVVRRFGISREERLVSPVERVANLYTGNTAGGRGALAYNPTMGVVSGAGAGYAGNIYGGGSVRPRQFRIPHQNGSRNCRPLVTMSMPAKMGQCIATIGRTAIGRRTAAMAGSRPAGCK